MGPVTILPAGAAPFAQDGPGWWNARTAVDQAEERARSHGWPSRLRTVFVSPGPLDEVVNAYLVMRDHVVGRMDRMDADIVSSLLDGATQAQIAVQVGLNKSTVSRRVSSHGLSALVRVIPEVPVAQ